MIALSPKQQALQLIEYSKKILIVGHDHPDGDCLGATLALALILKKIGKEATPAVVGEIPEVYNFFPQKDELKENFGEPRDLIISIESGKNKVDKLSYNVEDSKLNIIVTPQEGTLDAKDIKFSQGDFTFDLIIVLDTSEIAQLKDVYENNQQLFKEKPIINIDHHNTNKYFGQVNIVDPEATSTSEILVSIIEALGENLIDENIATYLLTGIIYDTWSFQNTNTTSKSLTVAAQLVAANADKEAIIRNIIKAKPANTLRLWGRILNNLKVDSEVGLAWSTIDNETVKNCQCENNTQTPALMNQFLGHVAEARIVLLLSEKEPNKISASLRIPQGLKKTIDAAKIASLFGGGGHPLAAGFQYEGKPLLEAEQEIIEKIKTYLRDEEKAGRLGEKPTWEKLDEPQIEKQESPEPNENQAKEQEPKTEKSPEEKQSEGIFPPDKLQEKSNNDDEFHIKESPNVDI